MAWGGGIWGGGGNAQKQLIIKTYLELILYKPVGKYQFTMACIRALVLFIDQNISCGYSKEPSQSDGSFKHQIIG